MTEQTDTTTPPGHSTISHRVHGWCSKCSGREVWEELHAWRTRERRAQGEPVPPQRPEDPSG